MPSVILSIILAVTLGRIAKEIAEKIARINHPEEIMLKYLEIYVREFQKESSYEFLK